MFNYFYPKTVFIPFYDIFCTYRYFIFVYILLRPHSLTSLTTFTDIFTNTYARTPHLHQCLLKILEMFEIVFWCFGHFSHLRACRVSVAASCLQIAQLFSPKGVWRGLGRPKLMCERNSDKYIPKKVCLPPLCGLPNWQTYPLVMYFWYK